MVNLSDEIPTGINERMFKDVRNCAPQSGVNDPPSDPVQSSHMTGDRIISQQTSQYTTNNYDWIVPLLHDSRITNASNFYVRVETISLSGIFGVTPSSGGTHGPILRDLPE
ncbi:hypothetical protein RIR_jg21741.t1 [Rhizophagus irregularis DAOM 181602=DAOM 197198]|nr:hypothetical protein RIR_jg21741.t1 [Rhizophagus irregularis DAOM 181602=DAOM 197198]